MNVILFTVMAISSSPAEVLIDPDSMTIARLQYDGGGDWYANPSSLSNLLEALSQRTGLPVARQEATVTPLDPALRDYPYLYMTGHGDVVFTPAERVALREYLLSGGFLHADDNYGMDESFRREMRKVFPSAKWVELPADHPLFSCHFKLPDGLPKVHEHDGKRPQALALFVDKRIAVLYTYEADLGDGWEDPHVHDNPETRRRAALEMGANIAVWALSR